MHISYPLPSLSLFLVLCNCWAWVICISHTHFLELVLDGFACARRTIVVRFSCISHNHFRDLSLFHIVQVGWIAIVGHCVGCIHTCLIP